MSPSVVAAEEKSERPKIIGPWFPPLQSTGCGTHSRGEVNKMEGGTSAAESPVFVR